MSERVINFSAGPAGLPLAALKKAQEEFLVMPGAGANAMEISHRSPSFDAILAKAKGNIKTLLGLSDNYKVLFLQGGASLQFSMIAMNFLRGTGKPGDFILTGSWGEKAIKESAKEGTTRKVWSGKDGNYVRTPKQSELDLDSNAAFCHFTSNETIQGVEFFTEPETGDVPLICDMSSDFLSRPIPADKYAMIYAGAQKNVGPAGTAVVILREDMLERVPEGLHSMLDYKLMAENDSLYNTPSTYTIYIISLTTEWLLNDMGGLSGMEKVNRAKAKLLYDAIDNSGGYFKGHAEADSRSIMNVTWRLPSEELEKKFIAEAKAANLSELKGHRSVGGIRASIYNAMPMEGVETLVKFMGEFQKANG